MNDSAVAAAIKTVIDRLQLELGVIEKTGFISYFLICADFIRHGREKGISCVARGSAAGSIVTYLLDIANVDPIRYGLLFLLTIQVRRSIACNKKKFIYFLRL